MIFYGRKTLAEVNRNSLIFLELEERDLKKLHESSLNFFMDLNELYTVTWDAKLGDIKDSLVRRVKLEEKKVKYLFEILVLTKSWSKQKKWLTKSIPSTKRTKSITDREMGLNPLPRF